MKKKLLSYLLFAAYTVASAQLQNTDFEQWETPADNNGLGNRPVSWIRTNGIPGSENMGFYYNGTTDAQSGINALRISIWYTYDKDMAYQVASIDYRPAALNGFYTYTENQIINGLTNAVTDDVAKVIVYLTKWNATLQQNDTIGTGELLLTTVDNYSLFSCPITYTSSETPDTVKVIFDCSLMTKGSNSNGHISAMPGGVSSILTIDNIALGETLNIPKNVTKNFTYPNPVEDVLQIQGFDGDASIYDATGKLVLTAVNIQAHGIETVRLQAGIYMLVLNDTEGTYYAKIVKK